MKPLTRKERIEVLLDHWEDFYAIASRDDALGGIGGVYLMNGMSHHPSVVELGRALMALREFAPRKYQHLAGYYSSPYRNTDRKRRLVGKRGKSALVDERVRERVKPSWVDMGKVRDAVALVSQDSACDARPWCFRGDPFIPKPLMEQEPARQHGPLVAA